MGRLEHEEGPGRAVVIAERWLILVEEVADDRAGRPGIPDDSAQLTPRRRDTGINSGLMEGLAEGSEQADGADGSGGGLTMGWESAPC